MRYKSVSATGSGLIAAANGSAVLWTVNINTGATSAVLKIYDNATATGTPVATIDATSKSSHAYGFLMPSGIFYDLSGGNADVSIGYS